MRLRTSDTPSESFLTQVSRVPTLASDSIPDLTDPNLYLLHHLGAAHILLFNSVDLGKNTPYALGAPQLVPLLSGWANSFRDALFHYFGPYGADNENPKVAVVDTFALANIINGAYEQFQFNPATRGVPCVRAGVNGAAGTVCTPEVAAQSMFWDQVRCARLPRRG